MNGLDIHEELKTEDKIKAPASGHYRYNGRKFCVYTKYYGQYLLVRSFVSAYPLRSAVQSTLLVFSIYWGVCAVLWIIMWYMKVKLAGI